MNIVHGKTSPAGNGFISCLKKNVITGHRATQEVLVYPLCQRISSMLNNHIYKREKGEDVY
jgi:hypothetical protein